MPIAALGAGCISGCKTGILVRNQPRDKCRSSKKFLAGAQSIHSKMQAESHRRSKQHAPMKKKRDHPATICGRGVADRGGGCVAKCGSTTTRCASRAAGDST